MRGIRVMSLALVVGAASAQAQDPQTAMIMATVHKVFDAMRTRDTVLLASAFDTTARLVGPPRGTGTSVSLISPTQFGAALTRAPAGDVWNERIFDAEVR